jgi:hypothetical protein
MDDHLLRQAIAEVLRYRHDEAVAANYAVFHTEPPTDKGTYVYTYYDLTGDPLYHGYTTNAPQRALEHYKRAPWATWAETVRYRLCKTPQQARALEQRLIKKVPCLCSSAPGRVRAFRGCDWSEFDRRHKLNHVTGDCKLPGGA